MKEEFDNELLMEEEANALKEKLPLGDEEEPTSTEEEKVVVEGEPSPPEKKEEAPAKAAPEVKPPEPPPVAIDGVLTKDGKNVIPFNVLEQERTKRQESEKQAKETADRLAAAEAELTELKKPKKEAPPPPPAKEEVKPTVDFKELGKKLYESEEGAAEVLEKVFNMGAEAGRAGGAEAAVSTTIEKSFQDEVAKIKGDNPWITPGFVESSLFNRGLELMEERGINPNDLKGMLQAARDAVTEGKQLFKVDTPSKENLQSEIDKAVKSAVDKNTKDILAKFNIKEPEITTLADVRNLSPDITSKFDELDKLVGIDYEEAYSLLTPKEKEAYNMRVDQS